MAAPMKIYTPKVRGDDGPTIEFGVVFLRDGMEETHEFTARPRMGWQDLTGLVPLMSAQSEDGITEEAVRTISNMIRRGLVNDDGTPEKWEPNVVAGYFTAPSGDHTPVGMLPAFDAFEAGSSRRRWVHLMAHDDDVTVEADQVAEILTDLVSAAAQRPTQRSAASPG